MKLKKVLFALSFVFASLLVVGITSFAQGTDNNGMGNMMNGNGMMNMMENSNMNSPEGQRMMNACRDFMDSYSGEKEDK